jgi:hypothetical protein
MYIVPFKSTKIDVGLYNSEYPVPPVKVKPATVVADGTPIPPELGKRKMFYKK